MKRYIYLRVSSEQQSFDQQHHCIYEYFKKVGIEPQSVSAQVVEKVSGTIKHTDRKLSSLIDRCKQGDVIFVSELSRISRTMSDLFAIVTECAEKGVTIIQCKDGSTIENESIGGKALLFALSLAAEIEVSNIRQRTNMGLEVRKKRQANGKKWISNSGRECNRLGRPADGIDEKTGEPYWDVSAMVEAAAQAKQEAKIRWKEGSSAYKWVKARVAEGMPRKEILRLFNEQHELNPEVYCTREGKPLSKGVLSKWCREMNPLTV